MSSAVFEQHAVDDEPHEQRLDHLQARGDQREHEERADRVAMRPQPAQVFAQVLAPFAAEGPFRLRGRFGRLLDRLGILGCFHDSVESTLPVVLYKSLVALAGRARCFMD